MAGAQTPPMSIVWILLPTHPSWTPALLAWQMSVPGQVLGETGSQTVTAELAFWSWATTAGDEQKATHCPNWVQASCPLEQVHLDARLLVISQMESGLVQSDLTWQQPNGVSASLQQQQTYNLHHQVCCCAL